MKLSNYHKNLLNHIHAQINEERDKQGLPNITKTQAVQYCLEFIASRNSSYVADVFIKGF